ncbi:hypothetical protein HK405_010895, partial [Cladochytrium tenue]
WIQDFKNRLDQLSKICQNTSDILENPVWIGGLFTPEAYITASRQAVAQKNQWSLEELRLEVAVTDEPGANAFILTGMKLEGAEYSAAGIVLSSSVASPLKAVRLTWVQELRGTKLAQISVTNRVGLPVYLNDDRSDLLFTAELPVDNANIPNIIQQAVAIVAL